MDSRKLIKLGNNSHVISLPNNWIKNNSLTKGNSIYFFENENGEIVLKPSFKETEDIIREITISVDGKKNDRIKREIISAYINDVKIIKLVGDTIPTKAHFLKQSINNSFMATEIMEQTSKRIVIKDFLTIKYESAAEIIQRMDIILRSIFFDFRSAPYHSVFERRTEINRWYFLMMRTKRSLLTTNKCNSKTDIINVIRYWKAAYNIEDMSSQLEKLARVLKKLNKKDKKIIFDFCKEIEGYYLQTLKAYKKHDKDLAYKISNLKRKYYTACDNLMKTKNHSIDFYYCVDKIKMIIRQVHAIGRVVYT